MDVISRNAAPPSSLNPNAPMFVPSIYRAVEDFSDQWWSLIHSSPSFRDYWLRECFHDPQIDLLFAQNDDSVSALLNFDSLFDYNTTTREEEEERDLRKDLISLGALKWQKPRGSSEMPRYGAKAPKIVNVKVSPRPIQQPR